MKVSSRLACLSAAALAALYGTSVHAQALNFDSDTDTPGIQDGGGDWNLTNTNWYDGTNNVIWDNVTPGNAFFGAGLGTATFDANVTNDVLLRSAINVNNLTFNLGNDGGYYRILDTSSSAGTLTINGNVTKDASAGNNLIRLRNDIILSGAAHTFVMNDTGGDSAPEMLIQANTSNAVGAHGITGTGSVILDNGSYDQYGTLMFQGANAYTGGTQINKGRLEITNSLGLGTGSVLIGQTNLGGGALFIGGSGISQDAAVTLDNAITITRNNYGGNGTNFNAYTDALVSENTAGTHVLTVNNLTIDSTDGRVAARTSTINLPNTVLAGATAGANSVLTLDGDFAGTINLTGDNSVANAVGAIRMIGGVEVVINNINNVGGLSKQLQMNGGTLKIPSSFTALSQINVATTNFGGGFDIPAGQTFTIDTAVSGSSTGKRGTGTLNINAALSLPTGSTFFDGGVVNINNSGTFGSIHLRSPTVNIPTGVVVTTQAGFTSWGESSNGTLLPGGTLGPDKATVNLAGSYLQTNNDDFNLGDNGGTAGTLNMSGSAVFQTTGALFLGKGASSTGYISVPTGTTMNNKSLVFVGIGDLGVGTIDQTGGTITGTRTGDFSFVLGDGRGNRNATGNYNFSAGSLLLGGQTYVGEGSLGKGNWTQTGGTGTINNLFIIGREAATGTMSVSGGSDTINGELWVANGGSNGTLNVSGSGAVTVTNWLAVGRESGTGTLLLTGNGSVTKSGGGDLIMGSLSGKGTLIQSGGTLTANATDLGEDTGAGTYIMNGGVATLGRVVMGTRGTGVGTIALNGGTMTVDNIRRGTVSTAQVVQLNGGVLRPSVDDAVNFVGTAITSVVQAGGAKIDLNGHSITYNSPLTHDAALATADGGLTVTGAGTFNVVGASTYTGATIINATNGTLKTKYTATGASASSPLLTGAGVDIRAGQLVLDYTGSTTPLQTVKNLVNTSYNGGVNRFQTGTIRDTTITSTHRGLGYLDATGTSTVTVKETYLGDANLDGLVDVGDLSILASNYGSTTAVWQQADFTYDGNVDVGDLSVLASEYGDGTPSPALAQAQLSADLLKVEAEYPAFAAAITGTGVPEPTVTAMVVMAGGMLAARRRRSM